LVWLVGVAELFRFDIETILHFADVGGEDSLVRRLRNFLGNKCTMQLEQSLQFFLENV
jgi:hypothetical protein